jgi:hypothetical protein
MSDESRKPDQEDNLSGGNKGVEPSGLITSSPNAYNSWRQLGFALVIFTILCGVVFAISAGGFYLINENNRIQNVQNTATVEVAQTQATPDANIAATPVAYQTEPANYSFVETFDNNERDWYVGKLVDGEFLSWKNFIENGVYIWEFTNLKQDSLWKHYTSGGSYQPPKVLGDFDMYVDGIMKEGDPAHYCYGLIFRESPEGIEHGAYRFGMCGDSTEISYYNKENGWEQIVGGLTSVSIKAGDWNRLGVSARGSHFVFTVNNAHIFEMDDDRRATGYISVFVDVLDNLVPGTVWFDNFSLQTH